MRGPRRTWFGAGLLAILVACQAGPTTSPSPEASRSGTPPGSAVLPTSTAAPTASPAPDPAADLERLVTVLEAAHPDPWHGIGREEFGAAVDDYLDRLPGLSAEEATVELMRVVALLSRAGRDGHQFAFPTERHDGPMLPLRVYEFSEGLFVTDALPPHRELVGARLTAINGHPIEEVLGAIEPLVPRDGPATVPAHRPILFLRTTVLRGLGFAGPGAVELQVVDGAGAERRVSVEPVAADEHRDWAGRFGTYRLPNVPEPAYLARDETLATEVLDDGATVVLRYRFVASGDTDEARRLLAGDGVERLIVDLRQNPGGDNGTYGRLLRLVQGWAAEHPGATFVLTDRVTFSAAANLATELEGSTDAVFVGEAMGGSPNLYGDTTWLELPSQPIPMRVAIATRYWEMSTPDDDRLTIPPDIPIEVTAADHFSGRDPGIEAALAASVPWTEPASR